MLFAKGGISMELRVLRYFLAVAREESISRAADKLHITQPTLSRQLMDLETELDTRLFDRSRQSRSITLTKEGWRFLQRAEEIVELADRTAAEFRPEPDALEGDLYIGLPDGQIDILENLIRTIALLNVVQ